MGKKPLSDKNTMRGRTVSGDKLVIDARRKRQFVADLREKLPPVNCIFQCSICCIDAPLMLFLEWQLIGQGMRGQMTPCPFRYQDGSGCSIYVQRPVICRLYGTLPAGSLHYLSCCEGRGPDTPVAREWIDEQTIIFMGLLTMEISAIIKRSPSRQELLWLRYLQKCRPWYRVEEMVNLFSEAQSHESQEAPAAHP